MDKNWIKHKKWKKQEKIGTKTLKKNRNKKNVWKNGSIKNKNQQKMRQNKSVYSSSCNANQPFDRK